MFDTFVKVEWNDSCLQHDPVNTEELPKPTIMTSVGFLAKETDNYIVISRDHSPVENTYPWRSSVAIPKDHIIDREILIPKL